jgi:uncharacterized membrane protein
MRTRAEQALAAEKERHDRELATTRSRFRRVNRRFRLLLALIVGTVAFLLLDLAVGLRTAWSILVGASVLIGLYALLAAWAGKGPDDS